MNIFSKSNGPETPVDMDELERNVRATLPESIKPYPPREKPTYSPLQVIAHAVTKLTWQDAEAMGNAIAEKLASENDLAKRNLTAAIQSWAKDWESFT